MMTTFLLRMGGISIGYCGGTGTEIVGVINGSLDISMNKYPEVVTWKAGEILSGVVGISTDIISCFSIIIGSFLVYIHIYKYIYIYSILEQNQLTL